MQLRPLPPDDELAIHRLVHRYADAVVHRDAGQWAACWAEDAVWDLGQGRLVEGREAILELWLRAMSTFAAVVQLVHNGEVVSGATDAEATGRWYIDERYRRADGTSGMLLAHYDDVYARAEGEWRFARRLLQAHYNGAVELTADFANTRDALAARGLSPDV
jgi:ketosteroid isomerase-like protein